MMKNYLLVACTLSCLAILTSHDSRAALRAGAAAIDVTPKELPVIQNGGFLERQVRLVADPIYARALVIESGGDAGDASASSGGAVCPSQRLRSRK